MQFAAFSCGVLTSTPFDQVEVQMEASREAVGMRCLVDNRVHHFCIDPFLVDGVLPQRRCRGSDRVSDSDDVRTKELPGNDALDEWDPRTWTNPCLHQRWPVYTVRRALYLEHHPCY